MNENYYLKYTITIDDLIAFNMYHFENSPSMQREFHRSQRGIPGVIFILSLFQAILESKIQVLIHGLVVALLFYVFFTYSYYSSIKRNAKRMLREGSGKGIIGEHILERTDTEIVERTNFNEMKNNIASLERIGASSEHAFIYISSIHAHVIPRSSIIEGDFEGFLQELNRKVEATPQASDN